MMLRPVFGAGRWRLIVFLLTSCVVASAQNGALRRSVLLAGNSDSFEKVAVPASPGNWSQLAKFPQFKDLNFCCSAYGAGVGISGDTVVVGNPDSWIAGRGADLFLKPKNGWHNAIRSAVLRVDGSTLHDDSNVPLAIDGDTIVIAGIGAVYVYVKPASGWTTMSPTATLIASDGALGDGFGIAVALEGNTIVVGAPGRNSGAGAAYVFVKPAAGWRRMTESARLTASDAQPSQSFGISVSISGKTIAVGAVQYPNAGKAYVFVEPAAGWSDATETAQLTGSDTGSGSSFGYSISVSNDVVLVGEHPFPEVSEKAYLFVRRAGGWTNMTETAALTAGDNRLYDDFASTVLIWGNTAVVGAKFRSRGPNPSVGGVYIFKAPSGGWRDMASTTVLTGSDARRFAEFGSAVGMSGHDLVIGAPGSGYHAAFVFGEP